VTNLEKEEILNKAKEFFKETIALNHIKNTKKLKNLKNFKINPFLNTYLANFLTGNSDPESIAKALIYPRVLGTSITTSFGTNMQYFCNRVLDGFSSTTSGIDLEFVDQLDGRKKFCQIKSGPNTINKDDVDTLINHFSSIKRLARTNDMRISLDDLIVGVLYGSPKELNSHYKKINKDFPVIVGKEFWKRLTGDDNFYHELINAVGEVAIEVDATTLLDDIIHKLAAEIRKSM
jgi:hypothetical protein